MKILMCVPNISEGKDLKVVEQVVGEIRRVAGVKVQDVSSDPDHNRSVLTYLGEPEAVLKATQAMAKKAFELIDMTQAPRFPSADGRGGCGSLHPHPRRGNQGGRGNRPPFR